MQIITLHELHPRDLPAHVLALAAQTCKLQEHWCAATFVIRGEPHTIFANFVTHEEAEEQVHTVLFQHDIDDAYSLVWRNRGDLPHDRKN